MYPIEFKRAIMFNLYERLVAQYRKLGIRTKMPDHRCTIPDLNCKLASYECDVNGTTVKIFYPIENLDFNNTLTVHACDVENVIIGQVVKDEKDAKRNITTEEDAYFISLKGYPPNEFITVIGRVSFANTASEQHYINNHLMRQGPDKYLNRIPTAEDHENLKNYNNKNESPLGVADRISPTKENTADFAGLQQSLFYNKKPETPHKPRNKDLPKNPVLRRSSSF